MDDIVIRISITDWRLVADDDARWRRSVRDIIADAAMNRAELRAEQLDVAVTVAREDGEG